MFEKLGIVTNIWAQRMECGDSFEDLATEFSKNGFREMEIRDHNYLRNSAFGDMMRDIEKAMKSYTDEKWKEICESLWRNKSWVGLIRAKHQSLFDKVSDFVATMSDLTFSYAASHDWLAQPEDVNLDNARIMEAKKFAYLICPRSARFRIVDLETDGKIDTEIALANVKRYKSLLPTYPMVFAIEHGRQSATWTLDLARQGNCPLIYDEANTFRSDGTAHNAAEDFWRTVKNENLASIHIKQRRAEGISTQIGNGYVDFKAVFNHLTRLRYKGDLMLENSPTSQPLEDALESREYLLACERDA